jgi:hypothetical protein
MPLAESGPNSGAGGSRTVPMANVTMQVNRSVGAGGHNTNRRPTVVAKTIDLG